MPTIGDRIEATAAPHAGKTGTIIDVDVDGKITVKLDQPDVYTEPAAQVFGVSGADLVVLHPDEYRKS